MDEVSIDGSTLQEIIDFYSSDIPDTYHLQQKLRLRSLKWEKKYWIEKSH